MHPAVIAPRPVRTSSARIFGGEHVIDQGFGGLENIIGIAVPSGADETTLWNVSIAELVLGGSLHYLGIVLSEYADLYAVLFEMFEFSQ